MQQHNFPLSTTATTLSSSCSCPLAPQDNLIVTAVGYIDMYVSGLHCFNPTFSSASYIVSCVHLRYLEQLLLHSRCTPLVVMVL